MGSFEEIGARIASSGVPMGELIGYFRTKCRDCGHHRVMHDAEGACGGVMNKPCMSGCDRFVPE